MKIYMLSVTCHEGIEFISGFFSSQEKAEEAQNHCEECSLADVEEFELDKVHGE